MILYSHSKGVETLKPQKGFYMYLKNKDAIIHFRVPSSVRDNLIVVSKKHCMSISAYLRYVINYHLSAENRYSNFYEDK